MNALEYIDSLRRAHPELSELCDEVSDLCRRKSWYKLGFYLEKFIVLPLFQERDALIQLHNDFVIHFETKISPVKLAGFTVAVSQKYRDKEAAINYLKGVIEKIRATKMKYIEESILFIEMEIAIYYLQGNDLKECKNLLDNGKIRLDSMTDMDAVYSHYYWASSLYHKYRQEFAEFYKSALQFLSFDNVEALPVKFKLNLAYDLSISALLGDNIYSFGELLAHPIIMSLIGSAKWLYLILQAFNSGNLWHYQEVCRLYEASIDARLVLAENARKLLEKMNVLRLMEVIYSQPSNNGIIPLNIMAERTQLNVEYVVYLLMKCRSAHLIEGMIVQVDGTVTVSWVKRRVLGTAQIESLQQQLDSWTDKVEQAKSTIQVLEYIGSICRARPGLTEFWNTVFYYYQRELCDYLPFYFEYFISHPVFQASDALIQLYHNFVIKFETKIPPLKLAKFTILVSRKYRDKESVINYLKGVIERIRSSKQKYIEESILFIEMEITMSYLQGDELKECKNLLDTGKSTLDSMNDIDPTVYAHYYWVSSRYHKRRQEFAEFYKSALQYLSCANVDALSVEIKLNLAHELSISALLGDNNYSFGELLAHPIITRLIGSKFDWPYQILLAFNSGNLLHYEEVCRNHKASIDARLVLAENKKKLREKMNVLCLMNFIYRRQSNDRTIPLKIIAEHTQLTVENVEYLLMKCLSVHLIEGIIDQVDGTVYVSWVQPRVLEISEVKSMREQLDSWIVKVQQAESAVQEEAPLTGYSRNHFFPL